MPANEFTYRGARSASLLLGLSFAILIETVVLHLALHVRHPLAAWALTAASVATLVWLAMDYRALGRGRVNVTSSHIEIRVGLRASARIPLQTVVRAIHPSWRDLPAPGSAETAGYRNLMKPATPNALIYLTEAAPLRIAGGVALHARSLGLYLDDPDGFLAALNSSRSLGAIP